jgi:V/A-type H+-transporting ATPase subunit I
LIIAATDCDHAAILDRALRSFFMEPLKLPEGFSDAPKEAIRALEQHLEKAKAQRTELEQEKEELTRRWEQRLQTLWRQARSNTIVTETINRLGRHEEVYLLTGWIPQAATDEVIATVEEVTGGRSDVGMVEPVPGGRFQVPTRLENPAFLRPFETITATFGFPAYDELDPTPLVALTFVLMYGMMFGDVGHGVLLAGAALWLRRRGGQLASIATVLLISAISAIGFGFLYGSLFGREDILPHLWLSPLNSIGDILIVSIAAGIVLLNVGFLLNLISAVRSGNWGQLLFSPNGLAGIWFYWALLGPALVLWWGASLSLNRWLGLISVPVLLIFLQEPLSRLLSGERPLLAEGWGEYSVESFFELFETLISDVSNSLSFVRLGAFAVAHAGLSQIVLSVADIVGSGPGRWLVLVIGTIIVVLFEGLIVGIQALRLEYYEFFGKFFSGRGRAFGPLRLSKTEQL